MKHSLVKLQNLSKLYQLSHGQVYALKGIDLAIQKGEFTAIMGPSGSGKSTLLHLLGCLDTPTSGSYYLNGQNVSTLDDNQLAQIRAKQIGFVFQSFNLIPQYNVFENIKVPFFYQQGALNVQEIHERILQAVSHVRLEHRLSHLPSQLSGGEMQRVAIARALAIKPTIVLADEPTGNLDTETGEAILDLFKNMHAQGVTVVLITHDEEVGAHCQRIIRMRNGEIVGDSK